MRLLIDTNVILDYLLARTGFEEDAGRVFSLAAYDETYEFVSSSAITDIFYHVNKELHDSFAAQRKLQDLLQIMTVLDVTQADILKALALHWRDFEDAVQYAVALANRVDIIITRNKKDFESGSIPVMTPKDFLSWLALD
ncbi:MAG: PIN domain-containing protein [Oscillospiraceae bacterium]|nr:PIN domain-containing protein [Oscillospiraceae bacterium]